MSWLKPGEIPYSDYSSEDSVTKAIEKHGILLGKVLEIFNEVDPLHVFYGNNPDEYLHYVERLIGKLSGRNLKELDYKERAEIVRACFGKSQIEEGFVSEKDLDALIQRICDLKAKI